MKNMQEVGDEKSLRFDYPPWSQQLAKFSGHKSFRSEHMLS